MLALEILIGVLGFATVITVVCGAGAPVTIALFCATIAGLAALIGLVLTLAWGDYKRQLAAVHPRRMLSPLAFRLANSNGFDSIDGKRRDASSTSDYDWSSLQLEAVRPDDLRADDILLVEPGQFIHADGFIVYGTGIIDEAAVTGNSTRVIREACGVRDVTRDSLVVMGRLLVQVAPQPLGWRSELLGWRTASYPSHRRQLTGISFPPISPWRHSKIVD
jgi:cation transport ATPase